MKINKQFFNKVKIHLLQYFYLYTGINFRINAVSFFSYFTLRKELRQFKKQGEKSTVSFPVEKLTAYYEDKSDSAGMLPYHYFYQDLYVAQRIYKNNPIRHVDIGSSIASFVAHVAAFREIDVFDIRPLDAPITNVRFRQVDLMQLDEKYEGSTDSISCLHALEHFGLGRYGDPICYDGYLLGFVNIHKILKPNGKFYFSVPLGKQRVEFHAHRVFSLKYLLELITPYYEISEFSYINDNNVFFENVVITEDKIATNCGCHFGCAIFELTKKI